MLELGQIPSPLLCPSSIDGNFSKPEIRFSGRHGNSAVGFGWFCGNQNLPSLMISVRINSHVLNGKKTQFSPRAASSAADYIEEPSTKVQFSKSLNVPGCSSSLTLLGTGYRQKSFAAIIGVKVYAAGLYVNESIFNELRSWKGKPATDIQGDPALFNSIYQSSLEKTLQIALVRDVDGKTFWDALKEAVSPRVKSPTPVDESALSTFRSIFTARSLSKGTLIYLTWLEPSKMLVAISSGGEAKAVDATIESMNVTRALFDVFMGESPVSPTLKDSVASTLSRAL